MGRQADFADNLRCCCSASCKDKMREMDGKSLEAVLSGIQVPGMFGSSMFSGKSLCVAWLEHWIRSYAQHCCCLGAESCLTLCNPMNCTFPGSSLHRISHGSGLPFPSPEDRLDPGIEPTSPSLRADSFNS